MRDPTVLTALNLTTFAASGPLPADHIPANRSFRVADIAPFASNVQFQRTFFRYPFSLFSLCAFAASRRMLTRRPLVLSCPASDDGAEEDNIRIVVNDGPVALTGIRGCPSSPSGLCPLSTFIEAQRATIQEVDWEWGCDGEWEVPEGSAWETVGGWYPERI